MGKGSTRGDRKGTRLGGRDTYVPMEAETAIVSPFVTHTYNPLDAAAAGVACGRSCCDDARGSPRRHRGRCLGILYDNQHNRARKDTHADNHGGNSAHQGIGEGKHSSDGGGEAGEGVVGRSVGGYGSGRGKDVGDVVCVAARRGHVHQKVAVGLVHQESVGDIGDTATRQPADVDYCFSHPHR